MRLKVEIGDSIEEFQFEEPKIIIGADSSCHIVLDYEGIGPRHLRVVDRGDTLVVQDLACGFDTYSNNKPILPGSKLELTSFLPIEIGGIFIYAMDEVTESVDDKNYNIAFDKTTSPQTKKTATSKKNNSELEESLQQVQSVSAQELQELKRDILEEDKVKSAKTDPKKFRPQLYQTGENTESKEFKLKSRNINVNQHKKQTVQKKKASAKKVRRRPRTKPNKRDQYIGHRFNLNSLIIIFCTLMIIGFVYYKKFYIKNLETIDSTTTTGPQIILTAIDDPKMAKFSEDYLAFANSKRCEEPTSKEPCEEFKTVFKSDLKEGVLVKGNTVYFGIHISRVDDLVEILKEKPQKDREKVKSLIFDRDKYSELFSWDKFVESGYMSPLSEFKFNIEKYKNMIYLIWFTSRYGFGPSFKDKQIHLFLFDEFQGELTVKEYLAVNSSDNVFHNEAVYWNLFKLRSFWNYYLTRHIVAFISTFGDSRYADFNDYVVMQARKEKISKQYDSLIRKNKCLDPKAADLCTYLEIFRGRSAFEGIVNEENRTFVVLDINKIRAKHSDRYATKPYDVNAKKLLIKALDKYSLDRNLVQAIIEEQKAFDTPPDRLYQSIVFTSLIRSQLPSKIISYKPEQEITILGVVSDQNGFNLKFLQTFKSAELLKIIPRDFKLAYEDALIFFWKSGVPLDNFLIQESREMLTF